MQALHTTGQPTLGSMGSLSKTGIAPAASAHAQTAAAKTHGVINQGNLGVEKPSPAAKRVGHALSGHTHAPATQAAD
jgi:hypothetical protein